MANRTDSLRRILESARSPLTDEQTRELVAHLDDSVDAKVRSGKTELEAVAEAFAELGSVDLIARQFRKPDGWFMPTSSRGFALRAYGLLIAFTVAELTITPHFQIMFDRMGLKALPLPTEVLLWLSRAMAWGGGWAWFGALTVLGIALFRYGARLNRRSAIALYAVSAAATFGLLLSGSLPFIKIIALLRERGML